MVLATKLPTTLPRLPMVPHTISTQFYVHTGGDIYLRSSDRSPVRQVVNMSPQATFLITAMQALVILTYCSAMHTHTHSGILSPSIMISHPRPPALSFVNHTPTEREQPITTTIELKGDLVL